MARLLADQRFLDELWSLYRAQGDSSPASGKRRATRLLYARLHLGLSDESGLDGATAEDITAEFAAALRERLGARRRGQTGWRLVEPDSDGAALLRRQDGLLATAESGEYTCDAAGAATVRWPSLETGTMPGWVWFSGRRFEEIKTGTPLLRFYLGLRGEQRAAVWGDLVTALDETEAPFASKILLKDSERPDSVVVYCHGGAAVAVRTVIDEAAPAQVRTARPAGFAVPAGHGLAVAHPEVGEEFQGSLGMQRSELVWQAIESRGRSFTAAADLRRLWRILDSQESRVGRLLRGSG
ncbi:MULTISPECIES: T3SS effector HopA1 family protein [unclassified Crossiella]|uniref:T3SS effector HopA1 family protein n=1 Tax=unclassified Crossiella TaxID=2620835 RepID=UPI001FFEA114|nr:MULTISPECIES: T3SS effector HopA1 family protein [unclassified Crossiella]MCK2242096.1 T3SS effector HopA1 family protein [Crossiella sp. S99.2]MCK2255999.1 T3SS effector HopA1 family protein [Crossiella sp. S99.1]